MDSDDEHEKIRVKFVTKVASLRVTEMPIAVPTSLGRYGLSEVVNHLLAKSTPVPLEFLTEEGSRLLRVPLEKYLQASGLSGEAVLTLEYFPATQPPETTEGPHLPDWVSSIHGVNQGFDGYVAGCYDGVLRVYNLDASLQSSTKAHAEPINSVRVCKRSDQSLLFVTASKDRIIKMWRYQPGENTAIEGVANLRSHSNSVECVDFNADNSKIVSGDFSGGICIWSAHTEPSDQVSHPKRKKGAEGKKETTVAKAEQAPLVVFRAHQQSVASVVWGASSQPATAYTGSWDHSIRMWDMERQDAVTTLNGSKVVTALAYSPDLHLLASGHPDHKVRLWDSRGTSESLVKSTLSSHQQWVSSVEWIPDSPFLLCSVAYDGDLKIWDVRSHIPLYTIKAHKQKGLCLYNLHQKILTGGSDGLIKCYSMPQ